MIRPGQSPETVFGENNNLPFAGVGKWLITKPKGTNMGKNIKGLAGSTIFNQKMVEQMNGINKNNKGKASPIYIPTKKRK